LIIVPLRSMSDRSRDLQPRGRSLVGLTLVWAACGWHLGAPPVQPMTVGAVQGVSVEPGLRASLEDAMVVAVRRRGIPAGGPEVDLTILTSEDVAEASLGVGGTVAWTALLAVAAEIPSRPGCRVEVSGRRTWGLPPDAPTGTPAARAECHQRLAEEVADRLVDSLLAAPECR